MPPSVWHDEDAAPISAASAAEAIAVHEARLGLSFAIIAEGLALLALRPAASILWSTFKRSHAVTRFRKPRELALNDAPAVVLGTDHKGGFLLWLIEATESEDEMSDDDTLTRAIDVMQAEAEKITTERGGNAAGHYQRHLANFDARQAKWDESIAIDKIDASPLVDAEARALGKEAEGHEYAGFLAGRLSEFHERTGNAERAGDMAVVQSNHVFSAETLRADIVASRGPAGTENDRFSIVDPDEGTPSGPLSARDAVHAFANEHNYSIVPGARDDGKPDQDYPQAGTDKLMIQAEDGDYIESANTYHELAGKLVERGDLAPAQAPEPSPEDDPDKPKGKGPAPDFAESAFVLLERGAKGAQETTMSAHLFTDRAQAVEAAQGFPMSQEDAGRQGLTTWAEVHPVTLQFAANFAEMEQAGRLETTAALYSSAREIDGQLMPADPREPGAITGQFREQADEAERQRSGIGDGGFNYEGPLRDAATDARLMHAVRADVGPGPGGDVITTATYNPAPPKEIAAPGYDGATVEPSLLSETPSPIPAGPQPEDREPNRYAVLKAATPEAHEQMMENLGVIAESRDANGVAPAEREILTRSNEESTKRQTAELAAAHGQDTAADRSMTAEERFEARLAKVEAELTKRAERDGSEPTQGRGESRDADGMGMM